MALPLAEEALRTVQDTFPIYETISSANATNSADTGFLSPSPDTQLQISFHLVAGSFGHLHLARLAALDDAGGVAGSVLAWRRRVGGCAFHRHWTYAGRS